MTPIIEPSGRPCLRALITAMERLSRRQRLEIAALGRRAKAARHPRLRRLASAARTEAKRAAQVG
jgi:hypothetical protein